MPGAVRSIGELEALLERRLYDRLPAEACGAGGEWPLVVPAWSPRGAQLEAHLDEALRLTNGLDAWASGHGCEARWEARSLGGGASLELVTHVSVPSVDALARAVGGEAVRALALTRARADVLERTFSHVDAAARAHVLRLTRSWGDVDFDLLVRAACWFAEHDAHGLTPRQVPLEGFHAKWLDGRDRRSLVAELSGREVELLDRPKSVEFSYLDPSYLALGHRRHDSWVEGDACELPYAPSFALVVENKDSWLWFPQVGGGVCVLGSGWAGVSLVPRLPWLASVPRLVYWGDMDADGLEILDGYRAAGLEMSSILMDRDSFELYERFGTRQGTGKRDLAAHAWRSVPHLTDGERELYDLLTNPGWRGSLRVEQERIPLDVARAELLGRLG